MKRRKPPIASRSVPTINLEAGMPRLPDALSALERQLVTAEREGHRVIKLIHGYGSTGVGGDIRIGVQKRLRQMLEDGRVQTLIFGEDWSTSEARSWELLKLRPELKQDPDLGRRNRGITIVVL